jgi:uncharacterized protein
LHMSSELAGGGTLTPAALQVAEAGVRRVLKHAGVLPNIATEPAPATRIMQVRGSEYFVYAPDSGFFEPFVELGDDVTAGQKAGLIHFPDTPWREPSLAVFKAAGTVICKRMPCRTERGDCLFHIGKDYKA